jgi:hypothetical protein
MIFTTRQQTYYNTPFGVSIIFYCTKKYSCCCDDALLRCVFYDDERIISSRN